MAELLRRRLGALGFRVYWCLGSALLRPLAVVVGWPVGRLSADGLSASMLTFERTDSSGEKSVGELFQSDFSLLLQDYNY